MANKRKDAIVELQGRGAHAQPGSPTFIVEDPDIQAGAPTFRGTRITVWPIAEALDRGVSEAELRESYPRLTPEMIEEARRYAATHAKPDKSTTGTEDLTPKSVRRYRKQSTT